MKAQEESKMKTGKHILFIMIFSILFLFACGGGGGGGGTADEGTPDDTIDVSAEQARTEDILYTAFAGSANDGTIFPLYEIMVNGFANMSGILIEDILGEIDISNPLDLIGTNNFTITKDEYIAYLTLIVHANLTGAPYKFEGTLNVDINNTGYSAGLCTFKGNTIGNELAMTFNGYFDVSNYKPYFRTFNITASNQLQAIYNNSKTATYNNNWNIAMNIFYGSEDPYAGDEDPITGQTVSNSNTVNYSFLYNFLSNYLGGNLDNEIKNYSVGGSFTLDKGTYTFNPDFIYRQAFNTSKTLLLTSANGKIKVPGMDSFATVKSSFSTSNPLGNKTITSAADSYLWESGQMTITSSSGSIVATFDDGTVNFSGDLGSWSSAGWQLLLDPLK
jgi:hypothetical protein